MPLSSAAITTTTTGFGNYSGLGQVARRRLLERDVLQAVWPSGHRSNSVKARKG